MRRIPVTACNAAYPRNQWYVAGHPDELGETPFRRTLLGEPVVMYRKADGTPAALFDRCPHRGLPLSEGKVAGDNLQCLYHGIEFAPDGSCARIPSGGQISAGMRVQSYPLVERVPFLWIWIGDPAKADPADIPDLTRFGFGQPGWHTANWDVLPCKANYLLPFENLLDASHISFLHHGQIDTGNVASLPFRIEQEGALIRVIREARNEPQNPLTMKTFGFEGETVHRTIIADAFVPSWAGIRVELLPVDGGRSAPAVSQLVVGITPEKPGRSFEFTNTIVNFPPLPSMSRDDARDLLMEDVVAMEKIQAMYDEVGPERCPEISVRSDGAALMARKLFLKMIADEGSADREIEGFAA